MYSDMRVTKAHVEDILSKESVNGSYVRIYFSLGLPLGTAFHESNEILAVHAIYVCNRSQPPRLLLFSRR
jgi:hypothetical protein